MCWMLLSECVICLYIQKAVLAITKSGSHLATTHKLGLTAKRLPAVCYLPHSRGGYGLVFPQMACILIAIAVVKVAKTVCALAEIIEVLLRSGRPLHLGQGCHTRHNHVFGLCGVRNVLGPEVSLHTKDTLFGIGRKAFGYWFVRINLLNRRETADGIRLVLLVFGLIMVEINVRTGCHHNVVPLYGTVKSVLFATPSHDGSALVDFAF